MRGFQSGNLLDLRLEQDLLAFTYCYAKEENAFYMAVQLHSLCRLDAGYVSKAYFVAFCPVTQFAVSPDLALFATLNAEGSIQFYSPKTGQPILLFNQKLKNYQVQGFGFGGSGGLLFVSKKDGVYVLSFPRNLELVHLAPRRKATRAPPAWS